LYRVMKQTHRLPRIGIALLVMLTTSASPAPLVNFPETSESISPDGRLILVNSNSDSEPSHRISLYSWTARKTSPVLNYRRHVSVEWNSNSQYLFVNDFAESNSSDCYVYNVDTKGMISLFSILKTSFKTADATHVYLTCRAWKTRYKVVVSLTAYGGDTPVKVAKSVIFDVQTGLER